MSKHIPLAGAPRIWSAAQAEGKDIYRLFRKEFNWKKANGAATLVLSADSTYLAFLNGKRLPLQQVADCPGHSTYATLDVTALLQEGANVLAIEVHYMGSDFLTYTKNDAFLCVELLDGQGEPLLQSNASWRCAPAPWYTQSLECCLTGQLGYVFGYDARKASDAWLKAGFDDSAWAKAVELDGLEARQGMEARRVPQLRELPCPPVKIVQGGILRRTGEKATFAKTSFGDFLLPRHWNHCFEVIQTPAGPKPNLCSSATARWEVSNFRLMPNGNILEFKPQEEPNDGYYLIVDVGQESVGYLTLALETPEGAVVDVSHGEHLDDGRVRSDIGNRNFTDRIVCRGGLTEHLYVHRRLGCRYVELHITNVGTAPVRIHYVGLLLLELPLPKESAFFCDDRLLLRENAVSSATLKLCMHEHYEDCPWREQSLYAYDSRNQILYGYYLWGNYDFVASSLRLLGRSWDGDGQLAITAPGGSSLRFNFFTIPVFTLVWIAEVYEYTLFSGRTDLFQEFRHVIDAILNKAMALPAADAPGLYDVDTSDYLWHFCEWSGALSRMYVARQSPHNLYLHEALRCGAALHRLAGETAQAQRYTAAADAIKAAFDRHFWDKKEARYCVSRPGAETEREGYEHIQVVALANGLVPEERKAGLLAKLKAQALHPLGLNAAYYQIAACLENGPQWRQFLYSYLREVFDAIALTGATSFWETRTAGDDFGEAGSLCHGWSAVMPFYCRRAMLGVYPLEPGFRTFQVKPYPAGFPRADGEIPTPAGPIRVSWEQQADGLHVTCRHPAGLKAVSAQYEEAPVASFTAFTE